jgi:hypothetical protein
MKAKILVMDDEPCGVIGVMSLHSAMAHIGFPLAQLQPPILAAKIHHQVPAPVAADREKYQKMKNAET